MLTADIVQVLQGWFMEQRGAAVDPAENFVDSGQLDSFDMLTLVAFCEERFGIAFTGADMEDERFVTVAGLAARIHAHLAG